MLGRIDYKKSDNQKMVINDIRENLKDYLPEMIFSKAGPYKNGMINPAQLGGYDLDRMWVNGIQTRSLKGLQLSDGTTIENDIIVISLPHPSSLSRTVVEAEDYDTGKMMASKRVMRDVKILDEYTAQGWEIEPDLNKTNYYALGRDYEYGRSDIGPEFYDFGTPENRMVSKSTARRMSGNANVVIIGTRDSGRFSEEKIDEMTYAKPAFGVNPSNLYIARPRSLNERYTFDKGPGEEFAKIMKENLNLLEIFSPKEGKSFEEDGIEAYNVKTHPSVGDFGHYRGSFEKPEVVILADPFGYDDIVTARALTGTRGQYLHGLMKDMGVNDNYLVIKTVPFGMDEASEEEWNTVLDKTKKYRKEIFRKLLSNHTPKLIIVDGKYATQEAIELFKDKGIKVVSAKRDYNDPKYGINELGVAIDALGIFRGFYPSGFIANIPRAHLSFYARTWEGTSGDRVITSMGKKYKGLAFAEVVPSWAFNQDAGLSEESKLGIEELIQDLEKNNAPLPYETLPGFLQRTGTDPDFCVEVERNQCAA